MNEPCVENREGRELDRAAKSETRSELTQFGFRFGAAAVTRCAELSAGRVMVQVKPDQGQPLDIYISATGKSVRVFREGRELK